MPIGIRRAGAWAWRIIAVVIAAWLLWKVLAPITTIFIPVLIAVLLAAMLMPVVELLTRHTFLGRGAASAIALIGLLAVVAGMFVLAGRQLITTWPDIQERSVQGFLTIYEWAQTTFSIDAPMIDTAINEATARVQQNADELVSGALSTAAVFGNILTGVFISLFSLFFLLAGGPSIWRWGVGLLPAQARILTHESFRRGWKALSAYVRTQIIVAAVDAIGIALGMVGVGLGSYAVPIWLLVFLFSFIPLVGAIASGVVAVLLALVLKSWIAAAIMVGIVVLVQQIEGNVLQPILMGKAVEIHPLGVFLGVAVGASIGGIPGALFAIPLLAFVNATVLYMTARDPSPEMGLDHAAHEHFREISARADAVRRERETTHDITRAPRSSAPDHSVSALVAGHRPPAAQSSTATPAED